MRRRFMDRVTRDLAEMIGQMPPDDPARARIQARAAKYNQDCGCGSGAGAVTAAVLATGVFALHTRELTGALLALGMGAVLLAAAVGKAVGLGLASLKLALLRRSARRLLVVTRGGDHVYVH